MLRKPIHSPLHVRRGSTSKTIRTMKRKSTSKTKSESEEGAFIDEINGIPILIPALTPENFKIWEADMKVYLDAKGLGGLLDEHEEMEGEHEERGGDEEARREREMKAMVWFSVGLRERERLLIDLGGREFGVEELLGRLSGGEGQGKEDDGRDWEMVC